MHLLKKISICFQPKIKNLAECKSYFLALSISLPIGNRSIEMSEHFYWESNQNFIKNKMILLQ